MYKKTIFLYAIISEDINCMYTATSCDTINLLLPPRRINGRRKIITENRRRRKLCYRKTLNVVKLNLRSISSSFSQKKSEFLPSTLSLPLIGDGRETCYIINIIMNVCALLRNRKEAKALHFPNLFSSCSTLCKN